MSEKVLIGGEEIFLDPKNLEVTETNLNSFLCTFASTYDYFNCKLAMAQKLLHQLEDIYELISAQKFEFYKDEAKCSDRLAEAKATAHEDVAKAKGRMREMKYRKDLISSYIRSLGFAHDDALNLGYNLRKEMDKLFPGVIKGNNDTVKSNAPNPAAVRSAMGMHD